ncbi:MAG TPA: hypothetical protein VLB11_05615 [Methyloceanibacter sp.]|nr:hypothetical protein [Methyloceanibacter sp.]
MHRDANSRRGWPGPARPRRFRFGPAAALIALGAGFALGLSSARAADPAKPYLGMSKEEIIACAGEPHGRLKRGADSEMLTYRYSGAGPVPAAPGEKKKQKDGLSALIDKGKKKGKGWDCTASLVFEQGRLVRVTFAHKDARSPYAWQSEKDPKKREKMRKEEVPTCDFSLPNCHPAR